MLGVRSYSLFLAHVFQTELTDVEFGLLLILERVGTVVPSVDGAASDFNLLDVLDLRFFLVVLLELSLFSRQDLCVCRVSLIWTVCFLIPTLIPCQNGHWRLLTICSLLTRLGQLLTILRLDLLVLLSSTQVIFFHPSIMPLVFPVEMDVIFHEIDSFLRDDSCTENGSDSSHGAFLALIRSDEWTRDFVADGEFETFVWLRELETLFRLR